MTTTKATITDVLGYSADEVSRIIAACDTTLDGSDWSTATYSQIIKTAEYVGKQVI
jgi:hypothetical protein